MVNVGKREDGLLDWANLQRERTQAALDQIDFFTNAPRTAGEIAILNNLRTILTMK